MFASVAPDVVPLDRRWRYRPIDYGSEVKAFAVGPLVVCEMHWSGNNSKPCHHSITGGKLFCACQETKVAKRKLGYLPIFTSELQREVIILSNLVCAEVQKQPHAQPLVFRRSLVPCSPVRVNVWQTAEVNVTLWNRVKAWKPADIQHWLLKLWQDETLSAYYAGQLSASVQASTTPAFAPPAASVVAAPTAARENEQTTTNAVPKLGKKPRKAS